MFHQDRQPEPPEPEPPSAAQPVKPSAARDEVDHPHPVWWLAVIGGLTLLAFQGFNTEFYEWYVAHLNPLPGQAFMRWLLVACVPIHVYEGVWAYRAALRLGLTRSARGWGLQTLVLGYPSTHLIRRRLRAAAPGMTG